MAHFICFNVPHARESSLIYGGSDKRSIDKVNTDRLVRLFFFLTVPGDGGDENNDGDRDRDEREWNNRKIIEKYLIGARGSGTHVGNRDQRQSENRVSNFCVRYCGKWEKRTPGKAEEEHKYTCVEMNRPVSRRKIAEEWKRINELSRDTTDVFRGFDRVWMFI